MSNQETTDPTPPATETDQSNGGPATPPHKKEPTPPGAGPIGSPSVSRRIRHDEGILRVSIEAGVFKKNEFNAEVVAGEIKEARSRASEGDEAGAMDHLTRAEIKLHEALYGQRAGWRLFHYHQLHILAYHLIVLTLFLNVASGWLEQIASSFWEVPAAAFGLGGLGATLRALYYLHLQVAKRIYRIGFLLSHLAAPWIGALFGLFVYLLLQAGVLALEGVPAESGGLSSSPLSFALAFLAGFKWEWLLDRLDSFGAKAASPKQDSDPNSNRTINVSSTQNKPSHTDLDTAAADPVTPSEKPSKSA